MRYPKPTDRYSCEVLCENFMEVDERLKELEENGGGGVSADLTGYATEEYVKGYAQPKGNYLTSVPSEYVTEAELEARLEGASGLPSVTEADNNKILQVVNGAWELVSVVDGNTALFYADGNEVAY